MIIETWNEKETFDVGKSLGDKQRKVRFTR